MRLTVSSVDADGADGDSDVGSSMLSEQTKEVRNNLEAEHAPGLAAALYAEHIVNRLSSEALAMKDTETAKNDEAHKDIVELEDTLEHAKVEIGIQLIPILLRITTSSCIGSGPVYRVISKTYRAQTSKTVGSDT